MPEPGFILVYSLCLLLAAVIGYAIRKGSTCAVAAVAEMVQRQRTRRFMSFLLCSAIVAVILIPVGWLTEGPSALLPAYRASWTSLAGGALFGLGAYLNGACNFGTIDRLGAGDTRYLFLFPGLIGGAMFTHTLTVPAAPRMPSLIAEPGLFAYLWLALCIVLIISFSIASIRHKRERATPGKPVAFYMAIIGGLTALITIALGPWHYTRIAVIGTDNPAAAQFAQITLLTGLMAAVVLGAVTAAIRDQRFALRAPTLPGALSTLLGGALMGAALRLIPGGNDGIILSGLPSLSFSALVAYGAMCVTIMALIWIPERLRRQRATG